MDKVLTLTWGDLIGALISVVLSISAVSSTSYKLGLARGKALGRKEKAWELSESSERQRYLRLYVPLKGLFYGHFLAISTSILYPRFTQRVRRAWRFLTRWKFQRSVNALVDYGCSEVAEFECGGEFPVAKIQNLVFENLDIADQELQCLIGALKRRLFEEPGNISKDDVFPWENQGSLRQEELQVYRHIHAEYAKLNSRFATPA